MSYLNYNGISIYLMKTVEFSVEAEYDPSRTDVKWYVNTIRCQGLLSDTSGNLARPSAPNIALVKHMLETPRQAIQYQMNDGTVILSTTGIDCRYGPEPLPAVVRQVTSDVIFVEVGYRVAIRDCDNGNPDPVVSLRWECTESFNEDWYSRLTTRGRLIVRSDLGQSADSFRALATPTVEKDYRRISSDYVLNPNGTELGFTFVDQEEYYLPPRPATKASGRCTVSVQKGGRRNGQIDLHLEGPKGVSRKDLMAIAIRMCWSKLQSEGLFAALAEGRFTESLFENSVDVNMSGMLSVLGGPVGAVGAIAAGAANALAAAGIGGGASGLNVMPSVGKTPGVAEGAAGLAPPIRRRITGLLVAMFRDPCVPFPVNAQDTELRANPGAMAPMLSNVTSSSSNTTGTFSLAIGVLPPGPVGAAIKDFAPYEHYLVESEYHFDTGQRGMPGTGVGSAAGKAAIVTVHGGMMTMIANWTASRIGIPPVLPAAIPTDPNFVLIDKPTIVPQNVDIGADGASPTYTVSGRYVYLVLDPTKVSILSPIPPFLTTAAGQAALLAVGYSSPNILFQFQGAVGQNPFLGKTNSNSPNGNLATQLGANTAVGGSAVIANANTAPPSAMGGLGSGGSAGPIPQTQVNP